MLRDVFYYGNKPNVHPREKFATSLADARNQCTTEHFWIINEFCDYRDFEWDFDFEFLPDEDVWAENHNNVWPSIYQKDSGTWLCSKEQSDVIIYRADVAPLKRKNVITDNWKILEKIDTSKFDFGWHPDPTEPPYIYVWGSKYLPAEFMRCLEYHVNGATDIKYMDIIVELLPEWDKWTVEEGIDKNSFDFAWRPDPGSPPYIYVWGDQWNKPEDKAAITYTVEGASEYVYMQNRVTRLADKSHWEIPDNIDVNSFDFSWQPSPHDPAFIYQFGTQWQKTGGPRYTVEGATEIKYIDVLKAKALPSMENWSVPKNVNVNNFDFSWHPDATSPPYIYHFPTQWALTGGPVYTCEGATEIKYQEFPTAVALPDRTNWEIPDDIDVDLFDFSWHPYVEDQPYIYQFGTQWQKTGGPRYITPGVIPNSPIKYIDTRIIKAKKLPSTKNWAVLNNLKVVEFDYSWHPDETEEPYVYVFGNVHQSAEQLPTLEYKVEGATQVKYIHEVLAKLAVDMTNWQVPDNLDVSGFDFSWKPGAFEPMPYIYEFGTQWQKTGGPLYCVPGAVEVKYVTTQKARATTTKDNWIVPKNIDLSWFDFSWHPDNTSPPYIYQFPTQWAMTGGPIYQVPGATEVKQIEGIIAKTAPDKTNWEIPDDINIDTFDFSWHPYEDDEPAIYQFGTQWQKTGGPRYVVPGATDNVKYIDTRVIKAEKLPTMTNWEIPEGVDTTTFDFSWHPDDKAAKCIYQFGTEEDSKDGPRYITPGNTGRTVYLKRVVRTVPVQVKKEFPRYYISTTLENLIMEHPDEVFWALNPDIDYTGFNFDWTPDAAKIQFTQAFGSKDNVNTQTYFVNAPMWNMGFKDINYVEDKIELKTIVDVFFVDRSNPESKERFEKLQAIFGKRIQKTRYLNSWVDTINRCINRSSTNLCWILNSELDYTGFDFNYYPNPWQMKMVHVFGTQWSHWGTTFMVNRETFTNDTKYIKIIEHLSNLNFVKNIRATATNCLYDIYVIHHGNEDKNNIPGSVNIVPYKNNYYETFKSLLETLPEKKEHYIWVCSSICDYSNFNFTYICDPFAREQLHVFPSDKQKYGDTFLVNVNKLRELINDMSSMDEYVKINFNQHQRVKRLQPPTVVATETHLSKIDTDFNFPYAIFKTDDNQEISVVDDEPMSLWKDESKTIKSLSTGNSVIIVPKEAKSFVKKELYDYPYISKSQRLLKSKNMDVVFMSNNETGAEERYQKLAEALGREPKRVNGVKGRENAIRKSAEISDTDWVLVVPGKLEISKRFDFSWQPDRMQEAKHYIFYATNPLNKLCYGHMAPVMYNKRLVLETLEYGLDFTMSKKHEIVPINTGIAHYNLDPLMTWRTAFREAIKLHDAGDGESLERLRIWLSTAEGLNAEYSIRGANDALDYYNEVKGDPDKLQLSFDWEWLKERFNLSS